MSDVLTLSFNVTGNELEAARACEADVFLSSFGNTRDQLQDEYGPYDEASVFMSVSDVSGDVLGVCRFILPGPAGLKTLNDVAREPWRVDGLRSARSVGIDPARCWDMATLGVRDGFRGPGLMVALALYHGILRAGAVNGIPAATAIMDDHIRRALGVFDYVYPALPGTMTATYLGSPASTPVYFLTSSLDLQRRRNPDAYRLLSLGIGLDGVDVPDESAFLVDREAARPGIPVMAA
jgi:hypothetical protein